MNTSFGITIPDDYRMNVKKMIQTVQIKNFCNNPVTIQIYHIKQLKNTDTLAGSPSSPYYTPVLAWAQGEADQGSTASTENYPLSDPRGSRIFGTYFHVFKKEQRRLGINGDTTIVTKTGHKEIPYRLFKDTDSYGLGKFTKWLLIKVIPTIAQQVTTGSYTLPPSRVGLFTSHKIQITLDKDYLPDKYITFINGKPATGGTHEITTYSLNTDIGVANTTA